MKAIQSIQNRFTTIAATLVALPLAAYGNPEEQVGSVVSGAKRSQHFDAVSKHLNLGGTVYGYVDVDGDVEKLAGMFQNVLDLAKDQGGDGMPPHLKALDLNQVMGELGLDGIEAVGMSSIKKGKLYHNKVYAHVPGGRKGLLKILGGEAKPFVATGLAPADSDLVVEQSINFREGLDVVSAMVLRFGGPEVSQQFQAGIGDLNPQIGMSVAEIFGRLDTRITLIARIHPDKPLQLPDAPMEIPSFDFLIALDDVGWMFDKLIARGKEEVPPEQHEQMFAKGDGFEKIMAPPLPSPDMVMMQPVVYHDHATKRVLVASTQGFLDECLSGETSLSDNKSFMAAMQGLPGEGNGLTYTCAELVTTARSLLFEAVEQSPAAEVMGPVRKMVDMVLPDSNLAQASVTVNLPDGILNAANSSLSLKDGVITQGVGMLAFVSLFSARSVEMEKFEGEAGAGFEDFEAIGPPPVIEAVPEAIPVVEPPAILEE